MADFFTVDQLAQIVEMHPRTIRRYIREGQLKALKVGGEWRIRKEDAEMFLGGQLERVKSNASEDVQAFVKGIDSEIGGELQTCAVLDCYVELEKAVLLSQLAMSFVNANDPTRGPSKFQYFYDEAEKKARLILWGNPAFVGKVLTALGEAAK